MKLSQFSSIVTALGTPVATLAYAPRHAPAWVVSAPLRIPSNPSVRIPCSWSSSALCSTVVPEHRTSPICSASASLDQRRRNSNLSTRAPRLLSSALYSTIVLEQQTSPSPDQRIIAEGAIVAQFPGGLTAVRLNDDIASSGSCAVPSVLSPDPSASSPTSSAAAKVGSTASGDLQGKRIIFGDGSQGLVVAHRPPVVFVCGDSPVGERRSDGLAKVTADVATVRLTPGQCDIDLTFDNNPSGVEVIDALAPVGQGQNMLLIGHDLQEMRRYAFDFFTTQVREGKKTMCVYASTTQDRTTVHSQLKALGLERDVHVIASSDAEASGRDVASKAARAVAVAGAACAVGEMYALEMGLNSLVVIDTVDLHKQLWDATTRVLVDVYGVDSVVRGDLEGSASSEMRAFYSSLIQRSAQYKESRGGGSVTLLLLTQIPLSDTDGDQVFDPSAFDEAPEKVRDRIKLLVQKKIPLTAETLRKIDIPIPTEGDRRLVLQHVDDLISMSDGQIWFDERRESAGQVPPVDPQRSVTRIGIGADTASRADAPALRRIADRLRLDLSQASSMDGADDTGATRRQVRRKDALLLAMHQPPGSGGRRLSESCVALLAAQEGYLDEAAASGARAGSEEGARLVQALLDHVMRNAAAAMAEVDSTLDMSSGARDELAEAIRSFFHDV